MRRLALLFLIRILLESHPSLAADPYSDAVILLNQTKTSAAVVLFEKAFDEAGRAPAEKCEIAGLLALLPPQEGRNLKLSRPRHLYAGFALNCRNAFNLREHAVLLRAAADGYFEHADFEQAAHYYQQWIQCETDLDSRRYAVSKLGWTYLNQKKAKLAYELWKTESMWKELGRAWVEALVQDPNFRDMPTTLPDFNETSKMDWADGALSSIRREPRSEVDRALTLLTSKELVTMLTEKQLENHLFANECIALSWVEHSTQNAGILAQKENLAMKCAANLGVHRMLSDVWATRILNDLEGMPASEAWVPARAELYSLHHQPKEACQLYLRISDQPGIEQNCTEPSPQLKEYYGKLFQDPNHSPETSGFLFRAFVSSSFREQLLDILVQNALLWKNQSLPILLIELFKADLKEEEVLLSHFDAEHSAKLEIYWNSLILAKLDAKQFKEVERLLFIRYPLASALSSTGIKLWAIAIQKMNLSKDEFFESLQNANYSVYEALSISEKEILVRLLLSGHDENASVTLLWKYWRLSRTVVQKAKDLHPFLIEQAWLEPNLICENFSDSKKDALCLSLASLRLYFSSNSTFPVQDLTTLGPQLKPLLALLHTLDQTKSEFQDFHFYSDGTLARQISKKMQRLKLLIARSNRSRWPAPLWAVKAQSLLQSCTQALAQSIEQVHPEQRQQTEQLHQVAEAIRQWMKKESP